ncbi:MAG: hypothetical protein QOH12_240, partial [Solirubrobacteraceae bacterium]|nr:hypothetical protein [Solirubrobacteraceae bacterium]
MGPKKRIDGPPTPLPNGAPRPRGSLWRGIARPWANLGGTLISPQKREPPHGCNRGGGGGG